MNWNRKSWNENKGQKWICKVIKCLKNDPAPVRVCCFWLMCSLFSASECARSHLAEALFLQLCLRFGFHFSLSLSLFPWLLRPAETGRLRRFVGFATWDQTWGSVPAGLWFWLSWARNCWGASAPLSGPRGSEDGCCRSERTSDPTLFSCSLMTKMWSWVRCPIFLLLGSFAQVICWPFPITVSEHSGVGHLIIPP